MRFRDLIVAAFSAVLAGIAAAPAPATAGCQVEKFADLPVVMMGPRATIPVLVNGHPARMIIDSGAFASLFTPDSARALGLEVEPTRMIIEGLGGSSFSGATVVNVFTLAGMPIHGVPFFVGGNTLDHGVAGVMGQNLLAIGDVEYDLADGANRLFKTKGCAVADLAYWAKPDQPIGEMSIENMFGVNRRTAGEAFINGARVRVEFDTGTPSSVLSLAAAKRLGIGPGTAGVTQVGEGAGGVGGRVFRTWIAPVASFKLGGEEIRNTRLLISDFSIPGADMRVGIDFFLSHRIFVANDLHELFFTYEGGPVFR
ncbi:MAG: aspartyl protease family protein, partial [Caulobacteraceae bacterium]